MNAPDTVARFVADNPVVVHDLVQGTPEWDGFRLRFFGASEAAAMLGLSKKVTRNELLRAKSTGIAREFSDFVQTHILDYGHEVEAAARPHVEAQIGRGLFPVTCSRGNLSASCDGRTAADDITWEHKQWNEELAASVGAGILPDEHWPQCQQNLLVTGAEKLIFTVSDGTPDHMVSMEVFPDHDKFAQIIAGWTQFEKDVAEYQHVEDAPRPEGRAPDQLPALRIELVGQVTDSNLDKFHGHALAVIGQIKTDLQTDDDFANAEKTVKWCTSVEEQLEAAKKHALSQTESIDRLFRTIDSIKEEARQTRLKLKGLVDARKSAIRMELVQAANAKYADHVAGLQAEINGVLISSMLSAPDFGGAIKGLKTISSLRNAIDTALANGKIEAEALAKDVRAKLAWYEDATGIEHGCCGFLFPDLQHLICKHMEDFQLAIEHRKHKHNEEQKAKLEADRQRIEAEAKAKAEREAAEKLATEEARIRAEDRAKAEAEAADARLKEQYVENDPLYGEAVELVIKNKRASISMVQRYLRIGYNRAAHLIEAMEKDGIVSPMRDDGARDVLMNTIPEGRDSNAAVAQPAAASQTEPAAPSERPSRESLIKCIAFEYGVESATAEAWLRDAFSEIAA